MGNLACAGFQQGIIFAAIGDAILHTCLIIYGGVCSIEAMLLNPFDPHDQHDGHEAGLTHGKRAEEIAFFLFAVILSLCRVLLSIFLIKAVKQDDYIRCKTWLVFTFLLFLVLVFNDAFHFSVSFLPTAWYMSIQTFAMVYIVGEAYMVVTFMKSIDNNNDRNVSNVNANGGSYGMPAPTNRIF